jgi:hypothetical protein
MKNQKLRPFITLTIILMALSALVGSASVAQRESQQPSEVKKSKPKKLREIAQERDVEISIHSETEAEYADLKTLGRDAKAIVLGRITNVKSSFTESGELITTTYTIEVQRVLKDVTQNARLLPDKAVAAPLTTPLKLTRIGGVVKVNGHRAVVKAKGFDALNVGKQYLFFLWWSPNQNAYTLAGGISGAVLVNDSLKVKPLSKRTPARHEGSDLEEFIREVLDPLR